MKSKEKTRSIIYTNSDADNLIIKQVSLITEQIQTNAVDLAVKELPKVEDKLAMYILVIHSAFQSLLEDVHKLIGAKRTQSDAQTIEEDYKKEEEILTSKSDALHEDIRVLKKQAKGLDNNLSHIIRNWTIAFVFLGLLSFSETLINFKIFLPISSNNGTALIGALGIAISFFIISHVFKNILNFFETKFMKWTVGISIIFLVSGLLMSFAKLRLAYSDDLESVSTEHLSEWNFVIINLTLFLSGVALTLIYKPSQQVFAAYHKHKIINDQIKDKEREHREAEQRLTVLLKEKNARLKELDGILLMAHHYEKILSAKYLKCFAFWCNENLTSRKDKVVPKAFSETPKPLTTYFDNIEFLTHKNNQS